MGRKSRAKAQRRHEAERLKAAKAEQAADATQAAPPTTPPPGSPPPKSQAPRTPEPPRGPAVSPGTRDVEPVLHEGVPVLQAADEVLMDMLSADRKLAPLILARLSPTTALVLPENVDKLSAALAKAGHPHRLVEQDHVPPPQEEPTEGEAPEPKAQASGTRPARPAPEPPEPPRPKPVPLALDL